MASKLKLKKRVTFGEIRYDFLDKEQRKAWSELKGSPRDGISHQSLEKLRTLGCSFEITS